jgi:AcrR family transcriptional regulator
MGAVKRKYDSPGRRRQAEATRRHLTKSARVLFTRHGYAGTTIEAIAREAGVAVQTFYATFGSKRAVLLALLDEAEREADVAGLRVAMEATSSDPRDQLRQLVDFNVQLFARIADVLEVVRNAGRSDPDLGSFRREGEERRRRGQAPLIRHWSRTGALKTRLAAREAGDVLWSLTGPDAYRLFVIERGWSRSRYADWLFSSLEQLLFRKR